MDNKYKFAVIIPIYNVEFYLEDSIKSVINQSIGFEDNIQLILVNDGSTDKSEEICLKYKEMYPENIIYIKLENQGASCARNKGLEIANAKYINFLDADDKWSYDAFDIVYDFFEENEKEIDVVACRQKFFEGKEEYHQLDYKFEETQIVDIKEKYDYVQLSTASSFIKSDILNKFRFDERLKYFECAKLITQVIIEKCKYGIISEALYNYRERIKTSSLLQTRDSDKSWYNETIDYGYDFLLKKSTEKFGKVLPYIQYQVMFDIQSRLSINVSNYLTIKEQEQYKEKLKAILKYVDDKIIMEQKYLWKEYKIIALSIKYDENVIEKLKYRNGSLYYNGIEIYQVIGNSLIKVKDFKIHRNSISIIGSFNCYLPDENHKLYISINDNEYLINDLKVYKEEFSINGVLKHYKKFSYTIPIERYETKIGFILEYLGKKCNVGQAYELNEKNNKKISMKQKGILIKGEKNYILIKKNY